MFLNRLEPVRSNSDFMVLDTWMSILRNVYISNNVDSFMISLFRLTLMLQL